MTTYYVHKSGNDANSGLSLGAAKKSIGAAMSVASADSLVQAYRGIYKESVTFPSALNGAVELRGIGQVIIDGESVRSVGVDFGYPSGGPGDLDRTLRGFVVRNHTEANVRTRGNNLGSSTTAGAKVRNCILHSAPKGLEYRFGSGSPGGWDIQDSLVYDCATAGLFRGSPEANYTVPIRAKNCTIHNCAAGFLTETTHSAELYNLVFSSCVRDIDFGGGSSLAGLGGVLDFNDHFGFTHIGRIGNVDYDTIAAWRTALATAMAGATARELASIVTDPLFIDQAIRLFGLQSGSPCLGTGLNGADIGARGLAKFAQSGTFSPTDWANGIMVDTQIAGGKIELVPPATVGTFTSTVYDLGPGVTRRLTGFDLIADETEPQDVVDADTNDSGPNKKTIEVRMKASPFPPTAAVPAWVKIEQGANVALPNTLAGRYIQYRLTLRKDGVEA